LVQAVRGCFFCTSCKNTCFAHNDVNKLIYHARAEFQSLGLIERSAWSSVQVDQEWDIFTAYRAVHDIWLTDLTRHIASDEHPADTDFQTAFFPGCSLAAYAPELTREIFDTVEALGGKTTLIDHCCGSPLKSAGFDSRTELLLSRIVEELKNSGVKQMVCVCPGCVNEMKATLARHQLSIEVLSLSEFLAGSGFVPRRPLPETPLCISKSCQDRDGRYLQATCQALGIDPDTQAVFKGCCGAGGAVSAYDPNRQQQQTDVKLSFVKDGATLITMCPTCTYTYAYYLMSSPRNLQNKHYAELLFKNQFDWNLVFDRLNSMWSGEYGAWLAQVLG
jgi:Fe-S oxidoreductase